MTPSIACPRCGRVSYHPKDIEHRFCSTCGFHDDMISIATPEQLQAARKPKDALTFWVIYDHPLDFPEWYVLRAQWVNRQGTIISQEAWFAKTIDELHSILPMYSLTRMPETTPGIAEVWME